MNLKKHAYKTPKGERMNWNDLTTVEKGFICSVIIFGVLAVLLPVFQVGDEKYTTLQFIFLPFSVLDFSENQNDACQELQACYKGCELGVASERWDSFNDSEMHEYAMCTTLCREGQDWGWDVSTPVPEVGENDWVDLFLEQRLEGYDLK